MCFESTFTCITLAKYRALNNIMFLSIGFVLILGAYSTFYNAQKYIFKTMTRDDPSYTADPYIACCLFFGVFSLFCWVAPSIIKLMKGTRVTMVVGSLFYFFYLVQFLFPKTWLYYVSSVLLGVGAAILWTAHGLYLTENSTQYTIASLSCIFWAIMQLNMLVGNLYILFAVKTDIGKDQRLGLIIVIVLVSLIGTSFLLTIGPPIYPLKTKLHPEPMLVSTVKLFLTRDMLLLSLTFMHTGINLAFYTRIYTNALEFTKNINQSKETTIISTSAILVSAGNVFGGVVFALLGHQSAQRKRYPIVITGLVFHLIAAVLIFLNLPNEAAYKPTHDTALIQSHLILVYICSFMVGFGDACYNTQIYRILGSVYADKCAEGFALYKSVQSAFAVITLSVTKLGLYGLLPMYMISAILGTIGFCVIEIKPTYPASNTPSQEFSV